MNGKLVGGLVLSGAILAFSAWAQRPEAGGPPTGERGDRRLISSIQGPALFKAYCASCHGVDAKGNGPLAPALKAFPPDLTRISVRYDGMFPLTRIERIIAGDEQLLRGHGSSDMPVWGPIFSQVEQDRDLGRVRIDNLTKYLRDIQTQ
jgi:mono/diheme cytochrome c family protein